MQLTRRALIAGLLGLDDTQKLHFNGLVADEVAKKEVSLSMDAMLQISQGGSVDMRVDNFLIGVGGMPGATAKPPVAIAGKMRLSPPPSRAITAIAVGRRASAWRNAIHCPPASATSQKANFRCSVSEAMCIPGCSPDGMTRA